MVDFFFSEGSQARIRSAIVSQLQKHRVSGIEGRRYAQPEPSSLWLRGNCRSYSEWEGASHTRRLHGFHFLPDGIISNGQFATCPPFIFHFPPTGKFISNLHFLIGHLHSSIKKMETNDHRIKWETTQQLSAHTALAEDPNSVPSSSTSWLITSCKSGSLFSPPRAPALTHMYPYTDTHIHINKNKVNLLGTVVHVFDPRMQGAEADASLEFKVNLI